MARLQRPSEMQLAELFELPTEQRELVRHYTLSDADLAAIRRCRGDHNRLGYAQLLCYLRFPGRALRAGERPPARARRTLCALATKSGDLLALFGAREGRSHERRQNRALRSRMGKA